MTRLIPLSLICVAYVIALVLTLSFSTRLQAAPPPGEQLPPRPLTAAEQTAALTTTPIAGASVAVFIELTDEASVRTFARQRTRASLSIATTAAQAQIARIEAAQATLLASALLADAPLLFQTQRVHNGVAVIIDPARMAEIAALPGVASVHPLPLHMPQLSQSVPHLGTPALWDHLRATGLDGETVSIGIIDTGIDYLHVDFGGPGTGYKTNDTTVITDSSVFPNAKVVGGYDFSGDRYDARPDGVSVPQPDPDPMDCWGHGTHVSGIAGGYGVLQNGSPYQGEYGSDLGMSQFAIAPGVAPCAKLYALKIFGCTGFSQLTTLAIEWAVDPNRDGDFSDRLDVLNLSLGSAFGSQLDPSSVALENASLTGMVIAAAAGNSGDTYFIAASPGVAAGVISVASSAIVRVDKARRRFVDIISPFSAHGPRRGDLLPKPDITAPGSNIQSAAAGTGKGSMTSSGTSMATPHVAGAAALLRQLHPEWSGDEIKALLLNTARHDLFSSLSYPPVLYGAGRAGAGRLDLFNALKAEIVVYNSDSPGQGTLSFGAPTVSAETMALKSVRVINKSAITQTLVVQYLPTVDLPGVQIEPLGHNPLTIGPFGQANVPVVFTAQANALHNVPDPTVARRTYFARHWLTEETGHLYFWPPLARFHGEFLSSTQPNVRGEAQFLLSPVTRVLSYTLMISATSAPTLTAATLRYALSEEYPVLYALHGERIATTNRVTITGSMTVTAETMRWLAMDGFDVTLAHANGTLTGTVQSDQAIIRQPVYAAPRPAAVHARTAFAHRLGL